MKDLLEAIEYGYISIVKKIIENPESAINLGDYVVGNMLLQYASHYDRKDIIIYLLRQLDEFILNHYSVIRSLACYTNILPTLREILKKYEKVKGSEIKEIEEINEINGKINNIIMMLAQGTPYNLEEGRMWLRLAYIDCSIIVNETDVKNIPVISLYKAAKTLLEIADKNSKESVESLILEIGSDFSFRRVTDGSTVLDLAIKHKNKDLIVRLLAAGAKLTHSSFDLQGHFMTTLEYAKKNNIYYYPLQFIAEIDACIDQIQSTRDRMDELRMNEQREKQVKRAVTHVKRKKVINGKVRWEWVKKDSEHKERPEIKEGSEHKVDVDFSNALTKVFSNDDPKVLNKDFQTKKDPEPTSFIESFRANKKYFLDQKNKLLLDPEYANIIKSFEALKKEFLDLKNKVLLNFENPIQQDLIVRLKELKNQYNYMASNDPGRSRSSIGTLIKTGADIQLETIRDPATVDRIFQLKKEVEVKEKKEIDLEKSVNIEVMESNVELFKTMTSLRQRHRPEPSSSLDGTKREEKEKPKLR